ncbi:outer membrane beta-barrel protein [Sphingobacterium corticis]|uniref:Outer membrane beta-barrel protein n=1 Tax=Sphingobacterium corticis TaxID=1812823 RepID=A0ABW5NIY1_9SPHI
MKTYLHKFVTGAALVFAIGTTTHAQTQDTIETQNDSTKKVSVDNFTLGKSDSNDDKKKIKYPRVFGGITFSRVDWGFSRPMDNGSFTFTGENQFLSYGRASNFGFDVAQFGVRLNDNFKIYTAAGVEWNYMRLKNNVLLNQDETPLNYTIMDPSVATYKKNVLTSTYLRVPIAFEWRSKKISGKDRVHIVAGPMLGILLKGSQRLRSDQLGKQSFRDTYNLQSFQYGAHLRVGFGDIGIFAKYYMNDMFEQSPNQKGVRNFAFGLTLIN